MHLLHYFVYFRPIFWYVGWFKMSICYDIHALVLVCCSTFHICHEIWYSSLIYFGISLYVIILIRKFHHIVHFDKCKCTIWLWLKLFELDTSTEFSSSFWYCQRGRDLDAQAKDDQNALWHQLRGSELIWLALVF